MLRVAHQQRGALAAALEVNHPLPRRPIRRKVVPGPSRRSAPARHRAGRAGLPASRSAIPRPCCSTAGRSPRRHVYRLQGISADPKCHDQQQSRSGKGRNVCGKSAGGRGCGRLWLAAAVFWSAGEGDSCSFGPFKPSRPTPQTARAHTLIRPIHALVKPPLPLFRRGTKTCQLRSLGPKLAMDLSKLC